ncbi:mechanosensitive ion channel family protein [Oscillatoria salina]|uniref:mechanosensitive ion channel family protein n=1 Tax=Oscillatoria salina TaxID=331517 RepID=UPI0013BC6A3B|nr:mechanosensitive ion channel domain-containing protein [Oscillatoria salina]MBZ8179292.1 mechanosensitive ion channel [Oscillatoria salina IIICB1]NET86740.1 mechanosensitive ion channel [Kamptonema sp. SIO1D9]
MLDTLPETTSISTPIFLALSGFAGVVGIAFFLYLPRLIAPMIGKLFSPQAKKAYQQIVAPYQNWLGLVVLLLLGDLFILITSTPRWIDKFEIGVSLSLALAITWLGSRLFKQFFDVYLLEVALQSKRKVNSEFLILAKLLATSLIVIIVTFIFAETHNINVFGLLASLGVGGLAVAFAAQSTLSQLLGGIVLYIDRPFVVDDYIGLPDGTFGRVESIGLRSTKIRTSGKGTLVIVPNNSLTQVNIENFTGAKKIISIIYLTFYRQVLEQEKALIRQVIIESTRDIFGIDPRSTEVNFKEIVQDGKNSLTQAQVNFFILGSGQVSMDLRRQLLEIANHNITQQLKEYGIAFDIEEQMINVDSPITI